MVDNEQSTISRRQLLKSSAKVAGITAATLAFTGLGLSEYPFGPEAAFAFGVSSGFGFEPWHQMVIAARVEPPPGRPNCTARWFVYHDPDGRQLVDHPSARGEVDASFVNDFQVRATIEGLDSKRAYYYRWEQVIDGKVRASSQIARTKTAPKPWEPEAPIRIAAFSCQNWSHGYYHAHRAIAEDDSIDVVVQLGDYVYADVDDRIAAILLGYPRKDPTSSANTLEEYRYKYRWYRTDQHLRAAHAAHPWIVMYDDHELWNDVDGVDLLRNPTRAAAAKQAWWEAMPMAHFRTSDQLYRRIPWGRDLSLTVLDSRTYRVGDDMWGKDQRAFLHRNDERQEIILNGTLVPPNAGLEQLVRNAVVVTGDNHHQGANSERYGMQVMAGAATSRASTDGTIERQMEYVSRARGYTVIDVLPDEGVRTTFMSGDVERARADMQPRLVLEAEFGTWNLDRKDAGRELASPPAGIGLGD